MEIRPIRNEADYKSALAEINALGDAPQGTAEFDHLDILVTLVEAYEAKHYPIAPPEPIDAILFEMDRLGLTRRDLEPYIGSSGRVSEILNRERRLTLAMIHRLHEGLGLPLSILAQAYPVRKKKTAASPSQKTAPVAVI